jgi:predicted amidophosphoribosyltransferase
MPKYYEDNFGFYSVEDGPDELVFLCHIRLTSVPKVCVRCRQKVYLQPQKEICATCSEALEYGAPPSLEEYE